MAEILFQNGFDGVYHAGGQTLHISDGGLLPYDLTYGAIASCLYSTFLDELEHDHLSIEKCIAQVDGVKRNTIPATVQFLTIRFQAVSDCEEKKLRTAFAKALAKCSMVQTFAQVCERIDADIAVVKQF